VPMGPKEGLRVGADIMNFGFGGFAGGGLFVFCYIYAFFLVFYQLLRSESRGPERASPNPHSILTAKKFLLKNQTDLLWFGEHWRVFNKARHLELRALEFWAVARFGEGRDPECTPHSKRAWVCSRYISFLYF